MTLDLLPIVPPLWAKGGHAQTLASHFYPSRQAEDLGIQHKIKLPDGDQIVIAIKESPGPYLLTIYHGLSGDMYTDYMQRSALIGQKLGLTTVLVNHRDSGPGKGLATHPYHSGRAEDISSVSNYLKNIFPSKREIALGHSMSANILLYLLSGMRGSTQPEFAICINAPINLLHSSLALKSGLNKIYDKRFVFKLRKMIHQKNLNYHIPFTSNLWDIDHLYTAKAGGFKSNLDYYEQCSSFSHIHKITKPTYVLTAKDDPFVPVRDYELALWSPSTNLTIAPTGGHLGYISKNIEGFRWLDHYLEVVLRKITSQTESRETNHF